MEIKQLLSKDNAPSRWQWATPLLLLAFASSLLAQVSPRITTVADNNARVRIYGSTHPLVSSATLIGRAPAGLPMERMLLQLASSPAQEAALQQLLAEQQDPAAPQYHRWLTPEQFGAQFGASTEDIQTITAWLESQGFQVSEVAAGRRAIEFSGTAHQVETAFETQINRYQWNGREHIANASDISIPEALAPVVVGVASLHDFGPRPQHHVIAPLTDFNGGVHGMSPYDFAAIYDVSPLWTAGYDGTGQSIAIPGESDIAASDVTNFRAQFGLPANNPTVVVNGKDPGFVPGDQTESTLDVEWAGAVAKGASIKFVTSASTNASDGVTLSSQYIVQHSTAPVMSLSYGACEAEMGSANSFFGSLWAQAAAEGIAVFVANGDSGSAGCDVPYSTASSGADNTQPASQGFAINGLASTPYDAAVGGTEFNDTASPSTYWDSSNSTQLASAKGYIPEIAWNESSWVLGSQSNSLYAGGGGQSIVWTRQSWQTGAGVPSGTARLTPDVSLTAAGHDGYVIELGGSLYLVGGTSASTPSFAGLMAIVNQYTHSTNGNPNGKLYALAAALPSAFHDVTGGTNAVPCAGGSPNCSASAPNVGTIKGYTAGAGYDLATGLGSVDANVLVTNWNGASAAPTIVSLSPNPMTGSSSVLNLTVNGAGFVSGSGLQVTVGSVTYQAPMVEFVSSSQLVVGVNVGTAAQSLAVKVTLPNGKTSNTVTLSVTAPSAAPAITSLSPNPMTGSGSAQTLTITGTGFVSGSGLKVSVGGTVYQGSQITSVSSTQIALSVSVGTAAQSLHVQVTDPGGQTSNTATLTVTAPPPPPAITSLSPNPMTGSTSAQTLTINGSGFQSGLKLIIGGTAVNSNALSLLTPTELQISVITGLTVHTYGVQVINANGGASNTVNLQINAPPIPSITSLSPNPLTHSSTAQTLTVNGTNFQSGTGLKVTVGSTSFTGSQVTFVSATQLKVTVVVPSASASTPVVVTNPSGAVSNSVGLTVK
jgi:subtilase family serine protease